MLSLYNKISIVQLCFYVPFLAIGLFLCFRHGLKRSGAWYYIIMLSLMRIVGSSLELATISQPSSIGLAIGAQTLQNTGLSPLLLVSVSVLGTVLDAMPESARPWMTRKALRSLHLIILVGLILVIVGGVQIGNQIGNDVDAGRSFANYTIPGVTQGGIGCLIAGYALITVFSVSLALRRLSTPRGTIPAGETRLLVAVVLALPFVFVRLLYSILSTFDHSNPNFRQYGGSTNATHYVIGMCTSMEIAAVVVFLVAALTLPYRTASQNDERRPLASGDSTKYAAARTDATEMTTY